MRLLLLFLLSVLCHHGFAQSSLKDTLQKDFAKSRKKPWSMHDSWFCEDSVDLFSRDTIVFHNNPKYPFLALAKTKTCIFTVWGFTSRTRITQSTYYFCVGHGLFSQALDGSNKYYFRIKERPNSTTIKLINYRQQSGWFKASRSIEYDSASKKSYPSLTLIRLKK